jgi:hypothetical protein
MLVCVWVLRAEKQEASDNHQDEANHDAAYPEAGGRMAMGAAFLVPHYTREKNHEKPAGGNHQNAQNLQNQPPKHRKHRYAMNIAIYNFVRGI